MTILTILSLQLVIKSEHLLSFLSIAYGKVISFFLPILITVNGKENIEKGKSYRIVANHKSMADIPILWAALGRDIRFVMKQELLNIPLFGTACKAIGEIPVDRSNPQRAKKNIDIAKQKVKDGVCVAFFPEGTRIVGKRVGPFKKGAFHFSLDVDVPVLPISIKGSDKILPKKKLVVFTGKVIVTVHKPINHKDYSKNEIIPFSNKTRELIISSMRYKS